MSPERIAPDRFGFKNSRPTIPSDCYSLGMVIYETISGHFPFHTDADLTVSLKVVEGKRPPRGAKFTKSLWGMLEQCWASGPNDRPSIEDVLRHLEMASNSLEPSSPRANEGADEDSDDWDSATNSSGGDSVDVFATNDHAQLPPVNSLRDHHLTDTPHASLPALYSEHPADRYPTSEPEEQFDSWAFPQYAQPNPLPNISNYPAAFSPISSLPAPAAAMPERPKGERGESSTHVTNYPRDRSLPSPPHKHQASIRKGLLARCDVLGCGEYFNSEAYLKQHIQSVHTHERRSSSPSSSRLIQRLTRR